MSKTKTTYRLEYWDQKGFKYVRVFSTRKQVDKFLRGQGKACSKAVITEVQGDK